MNWITKTPTAVQQQTSDTLSSNVYGTLANMDRIVEHVKADLLGWDPNFTKCADHTRGRRQHEVTTK